MAEITPTVTADRIDTREELFSLLIALADAGWSWSLGMWSDTAEGERIMRLDAHIGDELQPNKVRQLVARVGDYKICIGNMIQVLTPEAYAESFGAVS